LVGNEIDVVNGAPHPHLLGNFILERSTPCLVREWVHGFLLYDLLRMQRSCRPEEVVTLLESLASTLDFVSEKGLGLVDVSIRKLFLSCPGDVRPDQFQSLALADVKAWARCTLKLNPISLAPLLFRERRDWSSQTLEPSSRVLSMTQAEEGIRGTIAVRLMGRLVYELISGQSPSSRANKRPSPLPLLNEAGNQALWKACVSAGEATPFRNCEEFWTVFKESVSDRIRPVTPPPRKPEADKPPVEIPNGVDPLPPKPAEKPPIIRSQDSAVSKPLLVRALPFVIIPALIVAGFWLLPWRAVLPIHEPTAPQPVSTSRPSEAKKVTTPATERLETFGTPVSREVGIISTPGAKYRTIRSEPKTRKSSSG
jgi:hypothetical protein